MPDLLPKASQRAKENWESHLKDVIDEEPKSSLDHVYEDIYVFVNG